MSIRFCGYSNKLLGIRIHQNNTDETLSQRNKKGDAPRRNESAGNDEASGRSVQGYCAVHPDFQVSPNARLRSKKEKIYI